MDLNFVHFFPFVATGLLLGWLQCTTNLNEKIINKIHFLNYQYYDVYADALDFKQKDYLDQVGSG